MTKYHDYYDKLNLGKKDYAFEVRKIKEIYEKYSDSPLNKILEVGCGTGNHTHELIKIADKVVACDIDPEMIKIATQKLKEKNVFFHCKHYRDI